MNAWLVGCIAAGAVLGPLVAILIPIERCRTRGPWKQDPRPFDAEDDGWLLDRACHDLHIDADRAGDIVADDIVRHGRYSR